MKVSSSLVSLAAGLVLALGAGTVSAQATSAPTSSPYNDSLDTSPSAGAMAFDLVVVRPVSLVATVLGSGLFVLYLPLALIQNEPPSAAADKLVAEPARYTFERPLGVMEY